MKSIFGRHRVRANFYHFVSCLYVLVMIFWGLGFLADMTSTILGFILFAIDYFAQMYDPHPDNPGPWFKSHFHRFTDDEEDDGESSTFFLSMLLVIVLITSVGYITSEYMESMIASEESKVQSM